jgi:hypothetical protein
MQDLSGHTDFHVRHHGLMLPGHVHHCKPSLRYQPTEPDEILTCHTSQSTKMTNEMLNLVMAAAQVVSRQDLEDTSKWAETIENPVLISFESGPRQVNKQQLGSLLPCPCWYPDPQHAAPPQEPDMIGEVN